MRLLDEPEVVEHLVPPRQLRVGADAEPEELLGRRQRSLRRARGGFASGLDRPGRSRERGAGTNRDARMSLSLSCRARAPGAAVRGTIADFGRVLRVEPGRRARVSRYVSAAAAYLQAFRDAGLGGLPLHEAHAAACAGDPRRPSRGRPRGTNLPDLLVFRLRGHQDRQVRVGAARRPALALGLRRQSRVAGARPNARLHSRQELPRL